MSLPWDKRLPEEEWWAKRREYTLPRARFTIFIRCWAQNEKKKNDCVSHRGRHIFFPLSSSDIRQNHRGILEEVLDITMPSSKNVHPIPNIISGPYSGRSVASCLHTLHLLWLPSPPPLTPSSVFLSVCQLSRPTWPRLISVSYGSWRVRPSPLNTDRLAGLISPLRTLCSLSLLCTLLLCQTEKNAAG